MNTGEKYDLVIHRIDALEKGFLSINEKLDDIIEYRNKAARTPMQSIVAMIVGFFSIIGVILGGNVWLISSQVTPLETVVHKMETTIHNIQVQRGIEKGDIARLRSENNENNLFRDRWYNLFRVPERDTRQDGRIDMLELSITEIRRIIKEKKNENN